MPDYIHTIYYRHIQNSLLTYEIQISLTISLSTSIIWLYRCAITKQLFISKVINLLININESS